MRPYSRREHDGLCLLLEALGWVGAIAVGFVALLILDGLVNGALALPHPPYRELPDAIGPASCGPLRAAFETAQTVAVIAAWAYIGLLLKLAHWRRNGGRG